MSAPYYEGDGITLYLGDCREQMAWLEADVLVTDPPYGIAWEGTTYRGPGFASAPDATPGIVNDGDTAARDAVLALWHPRPAATFGSFYAPQPPLPLRHLIVMQKQFSTGVLAKYGFRRDIEAVFLTGDWPHVPATRSSVIRTATQGSGGEMSRRTGHPHAKPLDVMQSLIDACPPGVIADPFAGSGSTLLAARSACRRAIGVEVEERYCEIIATRLAQGDLFGDAA